MILDLKFFKSLTLLPSFIRVANFGRRLVLVLQVLSRDLSFFFIIFFFEWITEKMIYN